MIARRANILHGMVNRREFLQTSILAAGALAVGDPLRAASKRAWGVQLYTVRDQAERDLPSVLKQIHDIGYKEVETYWNVYTHPAGELKKLIADAGLTVPSGHFDYDGLESKINYAKELGLEFVVCPMLPKEMWGTEDGFKKAAEQFNKWGEKVKAAGMQFGFHNHNYEFKKFGATTGFDTLMKNTDPKLVALEMDCYWITQAGENPVAMFGKLDGRIKLLHLKDRKRGFPPSQQLDDKAGHFTEVGSGTLDWKSILKAADKNAVRHMFVERDEGDLPAMESLRVSYKNLQKFA